MLLSNNILPKIRVAGVARLVALTLAGLGFGTSGLAQNPAEIQPKLTPVAVVDMEHVLDNHPTFTAQMEAMKAEFQ
ncbi:MAG: hypothetical protein ACKOOI_00420, partial [Pirellula sp.]